MRIHRLQLQAFGPFAGRQEIDFDDLSAAGLHLIHGATGAGKTSILDAVSFALFGQVAGARKPVGGRARELLDPAVTPEVVLEATIAGRQLRFVRRPEHSRPKKRGGGMTVVRSSVELYERDADSWRAVSSRVQEVQHLVDTALGLQLEQFAQVMLLPQGEFAQFLHAEPDDREAVLKRLFDIERFSDIERWFADERKAAADRLAQARAPINRARTVVEVCLAGLPDAEPDGKSVAAQVISTGSRQVPEEFDQPSSPALPPLEEVDDEHLPAAVAELAADVAAQATSAATGADAAQQAAVGARAALGRGEQVAALQRKAQAATKVLADLDRPAAARGLRDARAELDVAERAARVEPTARLAAELGDRAAQAQQILAAAVPDALALSAGDAAWWAPVLESASSLIRRSVDRSSDAAQRLRQAGQSVRREQQLAERAAASAARIVELDDQIAERAAQLSEVTAQAGELTTIDQLGRLLTDTASRVSRARQTRDEEALHAEAVQATDSALAVATQHAEATRGAHTAQLTGHLAATLRPGEPCQVCGATEHPAPAALPDGELVTAEHVELAEQAQQAARDAYGAAMRDFTQRRTSREHAAAEAELKLAEARAAAQAAFGAAWAAVASEDDDQRGWLRELGVRVEQWRSSAQKARADATRLGQQLEALAQERDRVAAELVELRLDHAAEGSRARAAAADALAQLTQVRRALREHHESCPCAPAADLHDDLPGEVTLVLTRLSSQAAPPGDAIGDEPDLPELSELLGTVTSVARAHDALAAGVDRWQRAEQHHDQLGRRLAETETTLHQLLVREQLADAATVLGAARSAEHRAELRDRLDEAQRARAGAETVLADPEIVAAVAGEAPDLPALHTAAERAEALARPARDRASAFERARGTLVTCLRDLGTAADVVRPLQQRHAALESVGALINAERGSAGERRMRLSAYVLAARLEEVVRLANERLVVMTDQRFTLEHDDGPGSRGARGGLGLVVHDAWTGSSRSTRSLSGGETFLASLALALGLGDAIQHDAGGRQLATLFIDEGFGSLDDESLDLVLGVLDELRSGGRMVGIVSHVAELRQRIPAQIEVRKSEAGSTLRVRLPDTSAVA